ncbi:hypothetical protein V2J09_017886 [Rumex salicifolius]
MAVAFNSIAKTFLSSYLPSSNPHSSSLFCRHRKIPLCRATREPLSVEFAPICVTKRDLALSLTAALFLPLAGNAAILEADDDEELLERVKKDRQKRIERQGVINSSKQETGYLQEVVYKLSEVGKAIEDNNLKAASSVLGPNTETEWIKKAFSAFNKISSSPEQKAEVDSFNFSISQLIPSVDKTDFESSKIAFVSSASAFEKWTLLTGLAEQLNGL